MTNTNSPLHDLLILVWVAKSVKGVLVSSIAVIPPHTGNVSSKGGQGGSYRYTDIYRYVQIYTCISVYYIRCALIADVYK